MVDVFGFTAMTALIVGTVALLVRYLVKQGSVRVGRKSMPMVSGLLGIVGIVFLVLGGLAFMNIDLLGKLGTASVGTGDGATTGECNIFTPVSQLSILTKDSLSGSRTATAGAVNFYEKDVDPTNPLATAYATSTLASGAATINDTLKLCTQYRVTMDGGASATYYSEDFGLVTLKVADYDKENGLYVLDLSTLLPAGGFYSIATIDDVLDETTNSTDLNNGGWIGNESAAAVGEIKSVTADTIFYDLSTGDGSFYIMPTMSISGSNQVAKDYVMCFVFANTNAPEGNEISAFTSQLQTGTDLGIASDLLNFWSNEECVKLGTTVKSGSSAKYKFTITYTEANLDANDDWAIYWDDLGNKNGKDIGLRSGIVFDVMNFDAVA